MKRLKRSAILAICMSFAMAPTHADDSRARADYMIHCQGCHVGDGSGFADRVPDLRKSLPLFLSVEGGRAFLVQVPGSSQSSLPNPRLAGVLNWMIQQFGSAQSPATFAPYTSEDVSRWRRVRLDDVADTRARLIGHLEEEMKDGRTPQ